MRSRTLPPARLGRVATSVFVMTGDAIVPMAACPGCGIVLPGSSEPWNRRSTASLACHELYGEVLAYEYQHLAELGRWHQLLVDTYAAQHAGDQTAAITTAFALIGLDLALDHGWTGIEVRDAHQLLAGRYRDWPRFRAPRARAEKTVQDLALAATPREYVEVLDRWARAVWRSWRDMQPHVVELARERLPGGTDRQAARD